MPASHQESQKPSVNIQAQHVQAAKLATGISPRVCEIKRLKER